MTPQLLKLAKTIHEAKIALCWGKDRVGVREPWPDFDDPSVVRAYPHNPIAYVDIALAQARAVMGNFQ